MPALTIRAEFFKPEKGCYLHPEEHRPITHREAALQQSFDEGHIFCGSKMSEPASEFVRGYSARVSGLASRMDGPQVP